MPAAEVVYPDLNPSGEPARTAPGFPPELGDALPARVRDAARAIEGRVREAMAEPPSEEAKGDG